MRKRFCLTLSMFSVTVLTSPTGSVFSFLSPRSTAWVPVPSVRIRNAPAFGATAPAQIKSGEQARGLRGRRLALTPAL